ncbi:MAG: LPS assembly lipoprotein LptE [Gammaproteobacteria bacterium]|nr:LPS assembly lipoprotein LptE [Gammaproteobacteria bacterium]
MREQPQHAGRRGNANHPHPVGITVILASALALSACGFQLRGGNPAPDALQPLYVACGAGVPEAFCTTLTRHLRDAGVVLADDGANHARLQVNSLDEDRRTTAITATAAAAEYDLRLRTRISLFAPSGTPLVADDAVIASQTYRYDETNVVAKRREETELRTQLYRQLAEQLLFRLGPWDAARIASIEAATPPAKP